MELLAQADAATSSSDTITLCLGVATLLATVVGWLVVFLSGQHAANERAKVEQNLLGSQADIDARLRTLEASLAVRSHVQRGQYEKEIQVYAELWRLVTECDLQVTIFYSDLKNENEDQALTKLLWELRRSISSNQPFYSEAIYKLTTNVLDTINKMSVQHSLFPEEVDWKTYFRDHWGKQKELLKAIRSRVEELSSIPLQ